MENKKNKRSNTKYRISRYCVLLFIGMQFITAIPSIAQQQATIKFTQEQLPKLTIKRGNMFRAEVNNDATRNSIVEYVEQGYPLYLGHRNYNEPSSATGSCGQPAEFYIENGTIKFRLNPNMTALRAFVKTQNIQVFQQFNRVPLSASFKDAQVEGEFDIFAFQTGWYRDGDVAKGRPDGLLPVKEQYEIFADLVSRYIIACDSAAGINSIWTGFDEVAHTLGFRANQNNNAAKEENVRRYVEFFAPLAIKLKNAGKTIGGIQLNAANAGQGLYELATSELKKRNAYIDYFTIQNYQGGDNNATVLTRSRTALNDPYWANTKVFFNRYGYWAGMDSEIDQNNLRNTSREMITFLNAEKIIVNNADIMYGYAIEANVFYDNKDKMLGQLGIFLNGMPENRKQMTFENSNLDGFSSANDSILTAIVWNKSGTVSFTGFKLQMSNLPANWQINSIRKGSGTVLSNVTSYQWDQSSNIISGIALKPYDFLLVSLKKSLVSDNTALTEFSKNINFYPNPARTQIKFANTTGKVHVCVYSLSGQLLKDAYLNASNELNINDLSANIYLLKVRDIHQTKTFKLRVQ